MGPTHAVSAIAEGAAFRAPTVRYGLPVQLYGLNPTITVIPVSDEHHKELMEIYRRRCSFILMV